MINGWLSRTTGYTWKSGNVKKKKKKKKKTPYRNWVVKSTKSQKNQGLTCITFWTAPSQRWNSWKCHIFGGHIPMWVSFNIFEIAFFWKYFRCTYILEKQFNLCFKGLHIERPHMDRQVSEWSSRAGTFFLLPFRRGGEAVKKYK